MMQLDWHTVQTLIRLLLKSSLIRVCTVCSDLFVTILELRVDRDCIQSALGRCTKYLFEVNISFNAGLYLIP